MAGPITGPQDPGFPSLSPDQQKLLMAALTSNTSRTLNMSDFRGLANGYEDQPIPNNLPREAQPGVGAVDPSMFNAPPQMNGFDQPVFNPGTFGDNFFPDFGNGDADFDVDISQNAYDLVDGVDDSLDPSAAGAEVEGMEKRKSPEDDDDDDEEGDPKRREGDDKTPKKPGRKPLTSEPTTKRKAQNRAAQRAFRERKEKHLKDLEQKVSDLEKASESANHENGLLRAQVVKLQTELREYRKRMSLVGSALTGSPPQSVDFSAFPSRTRSSGGSADFQFDFTPFPNVASNRVSTNGARTANGSDDVFASIKPEPTSRSNSASLSPWTPNDTPAENQVPSLTTSASNPNAQNKNNTGETPASTFSPGFVDLSNSYGFPTVASPGRMQRTSSSTAQTSHRASSLPLQALTASTPSNAASPSNSSLSYHGPNSSCGTSPEPSHGYSTGEKQSSLNNQTNIDAVNNFQSPKPQDFAIDFSSFQFDPSLFGGYRDTQDAIFGDGEFTGGLYDDYLGLVDLNDPSANLNTGENKVPTPVPPKSSVVADEAAKRDAGPEDSLVPPQDAEKKDMMTYQKMWQQLQTCPKFQEGDLDIDGLCSELSQKATCSEKGAVVPKDQWEAALWRLVGREQPRETA